MPPARVDIEAVLIGPGGRLARLWARAGMPAGPPGSNPALTDPIRKAVVLLGLPTAAPLAITDADLAAVADAQVDPLLDLAELHALESCWGNLDRVAIADGQEYSEQLSQLPERIAERIGLVRARIAEQYGIGRGTVTSSTLSLGIDAHCRAGDLGQGPGSLPVEF